jgi:signal transduction histidine kinase/CheY-like chemotaxis protein
MEFRWLAINRAAASEFERIFGIRPMVGQSMLDVLSTKPEHRSAVEAVWGRALGGEEFTEVGEFGDSELDRRYYEMKFNVLRDQTGRQIGAYQFVTDVTTRVTGERQLAEANAKMRQMAKIETLGQLTGGVAHDFNNLLTPIVGALDILKRRHAENASSLRLISGAQQAADRATSLVQRLLAFARQQKLRTEVVDLAKLIDELRELLRQTLGPGVSLEVDVEASVPPVRIDPAQLELALINLAVNARDAMNDAGTLTIAVASLSSSDDHSPPLSGDHVCLSVTDTGPGMDDDMIEKAIEPFFTTKGVGKGTGLGLSMVHGVVAQFGGNLRLLSPPGEGLRAEIWLPVAKDADQDQADVSRTPDRGELPSLRVLLVDDDDLVRSSLHETLVEMGMDVTDAATAQEALASLSQKTFDLLLTDLLMPGMRGDDLVREACTLYPHVGALLMTGYAGTLYDRIDRATLISKPVKAPDLAAAILELHARGSNGSAKVVAGR